MTHRNACTACLDRKCIGENIEEVNKIKKTFVLELFNINKYIQNDYIYKMFLCYAFVMHGEKTQLNSNINIYEACFISLIISNYNKINNLTKLNILEIGLAYGTSALIILNEMIKTGLKSKYIAIDAYQEEQWHNIRIDHIKKFVKHYDKDNKIKYKLNIGLSQIEVKKIKMKCNIIFIDGSHDEVIVFQDFENSNKKLVKDGKMIIDDVTHSGVKLALIRFMKKYPNYKRICINHDTLSFKFETILYDKKSIKQSFYTPNTMFAIIKT